MLRISKLRLVIFAITAVGASPAFAAPPAAPAEPVLDEYYGTRVSDPYRWMESGKDPRWMPWLKAQADATRAAFDAIPDRIKYLEEAQTLSGAVTVVQKVVQHGPFQFIQRRNAGAQDSVLYVRTGKAAERVLVDPAKIAGGDQVLDWWQTSPDGRFVAVGLSKRGSEASVLHVIATATSELLPDRIANTDYGVFGWLPDSKGFSYLTFVGERGTPSYYVNNVARLHMLGDTSADRVLLDRANPPVPIRPDQFNGVFLAPGSDTAVLGVWDGRSERALYRADVSAVRAGTAKWTSVADFSDLIVNQSWSGDALWLVSRKDDSNGQLLLLSAKAPNFKTAKKIVIPGGPVIENITAVKSGVIVQTIEGGQSALWRVGSDGMAKRVSLPVTGTVRWVETDPASDAAFISLVSWFTPATAYELTPQNRLIDLGLVKAPAALDASRYEARAMSATTRDGTKVPYTVVARKGIVADGNNPLLLEAYGSYGLSYTPNYRSQMIPFLERGGIFVAANVRGGGEFGRNWHYAGKAETKSNTWRDAIDVAETLVNTKLTNPQRMTILGTSAGDVMVGQAVNERPDLFSGVIANVGFMNPIRYVSEQNFGDIQEWGGPITDEKSFKTMYNLDPYENVKAGTRYPAVLVVSGINDPRAATFHSAKYAARMAASSSSGEPVFLRIDFDAGHGLGSTRTQLDQVWTDIFSFALWQGGKSGFQPKP